MVFLVTGGTGFIGKRVVRQLLNKNFEVIASDINIDNEKDSFYNYLDLKKQNHNKLNLIEFNIKSKSELKNILETKKITHIIACGYQMSNLIDNNPVKGAEINIVGMTNLFQSVVDYNLKKMVFPSSQSVYGDSQKLYGDKQVRETDYCGLQHQLFTYAVMKLLNEFMAEKYVKKHKAKIACTRPSVVFGFGRKRSSLMWAEEFATNPALGKPVHLPFPKENKDNYIYVEDCAEQLIQLALKDNLNHFVYNTGSETASGIQIKNIIKELVPNAIISFDEKGSPTPFIDDQDDSRIRNELSFVPKSLKEGIRAHMNEARLSNGLNVIE
ncbi:MAG: GDP-L-fucose synthase [Alphaproteobacteria bacterium MarineAlpha5_Bin5]|nr:MAG: GDP-L-fucose synthase [Alphaproteobacteria bacterium MarineAlpha5_Bin4]PPR50067.1 MAG: GDP-L-fucose synthase [Alphaproteobacteria bacterium MarineAlpha5_Bin5]